MPSALFLVDPEAESALYVATCERHKGCTTDTLIVAEPYIPSYVFLKVFGMLLQPCVHDAQTCTVPGGSRYKYYFHDSLSLIKKRQDITLRYCLLIA